MLVILIIIIINNKSSRIHTLFLTFLKSCSAGNINNNNNKSSRIHNTNSGADSRVNVMLAHSEDRSRMPAHRSSSELLQNDRPGNRRWSADTRPGLLTGRHADRHLSGRPDTGHSNPSHLSGRLSPDYPVTNNLSGRLSPGYPVTSHLSGRLSPGYPVTSHLSGRPATGYPTSSHLSGRLSPGYPVTSHLSGRPVTGYPTSSHLSGRPAAGYPTSSHLSGRPATSYPISGNLSGRLSPCYPVTSHLSGRPASGYPTVSHLSERSAIRCPSTGPRSGSLDILNGSFADSRRPALGEGPLRSSFSGKVANANQSIREPLMHWTGNAEQQNNINAALNCQPSLNFESFQRTSFLSNIRQENCHPENSSYRYVLVITVTVTKYPLTVHSVLYRYRYLLYLCYYTADTEF